MTGVKLRDGSEVRARAVVITSGTFMRAIMHVGFEQTEGGRAGDEAAKTLSRSIEELGFKLRRLKTGTPPRLHKDSIDWTKTEPQPGDEKPIPFSFYYRGAKFPELPQLNCFITYTNAQTHEIIEKNFDRSPMFTGIITGVGPRYCPSIEERLPDHQRDARRELFDEIDHGTSTYNAASGFRTHACPGSTSSVRQISVPG
jgi:tRNA uridine 5-carboxymethylaminomethyl modification enzyme